jgi:SNF2 Helicase protein
VPISVKEAEQLLRESDGLALIKNKWVAVDKEKLQQTLDAYEKARDLLEDDLTLQEALTLQLSPRCDGRHCSGVMGVTELKASASVY